MKGWKELEYEVVRDAADVGRSMSLRERLTHFSLEYNHLLQYGEFRPSRHAHW